MSISAVGCGGDESRCDLASALDRGGPRYHECRDALVVALRETDELTPSDMEIAAVDAVLEAARSFSCVSAFAEATYEYQDWVRPYVLSTYEPLVAAWSEGSVETGDPIVDQVFVDNGAIAVTWQYHVEFEYPVSHEVLAGMVDSIPDTSVVLEPYSPGPDVRRERVEGGWDVVFRVGWGDCPATCAFGYEWTVFVSEDLQRVVLRGEGGDEPLPSFFECGP